MKAFARLLAPSREKPETPVSPEPRDRAEPQGGLTRFDVIAMALHEEEGRRLVAATHADLADHLDLITRPIVAR